ncbi:MAG TPA: helix-turn-helix transcriptional regulator [Candidatus Obscuribacter sp.]|nr:helix-turn-helix transcriptional regulator [Candidatus Obscuribacter sp.]
MAKQIRIAQRRVGKRIRELRTKRNWSQEFLAAESGLNTNYLAAWGGLQAAYYQVPHNVRDFFVLQVCPLL